MNVRAVLDANTLISAVINVRASVSQEIYQASKSKHFILIISPQILSEADDVLRRARLMRVHKYSFKQLRKIIKEIANVSYPVLGNTKVEIVRDPDDDKIISAALEGKADYIVTRDRDLLDLKQYQEIKIITPEEFMEILRSKGKL